MAKDYKYRVQGKNTTRHKRQKPLFGLVKSMLITAIIIVAVVIILYGINLRLKKNTTAVMTNTNAVVQKTEHTIIPIAQVPTPQFDFYTILPERDIIVSDHEIKMRAREEAIGKVNTKYYTMQAGSFKTAIEAEQLSARLATMGIDAKVQKAKVGEVTWYRVKLGPYAQMSSVSTLRTRLRQNGIDVVVTEVENQ